MLAAMLFGTFLFATGAKAAGLSGTYSIDASGSGNYISFKAAVTDLTNYGVSGPVVFNVTATTYTEVVSVPSITGASASNTIIFHGAGRGKTILTSTGATLTMKGYTTFDGMTISSTSTSGNCVTATQSTGCGVTNCIVSGKVGAASLVLVNCSYSLSFTLYNSYVYGGYEGVYNYGTSGSAANGLGRFSHNRFIQQTYASIYEGYYTWNDSVAFNVIDSASGTLTYGVYDYYANGFVLWGNSFYAQATNQDYNYYEDYAPVSGKPVRGTWIVNNFWFTTTGTYGIYDYAYYDPNYNFDHNTLYCTGGNYSAYISPYYATGYTFCSNIFYCTASGSYMLYEGGFYAQPGKWDGNDFYGVGNYLLCGPSNSGTGSSFTYANYISNLQGRFGSAADAHGTNFQPTFMSITAPYDLHLNPSIPGPKGVWCGIKTDHDGKGRFPTPSAGADEDYYGVKNNNAGVTVLVSPYAACAGTVNVSVVVSNLGLNPISGFTIAWNWNGVPQTSYVSTASIPLYGQDTVVLGTETLATGSTYTFKAWPTLVNNGTTNAGGPNDTLSLGGISAALASGTYTIDASKATSSTNFKTFAAATAALNSGVCGPVLFNVSAATYSESVTIGAIPGASAVNTVTFRGSGRTKTTLTSNTSTVTLNGSSYVTFDQMNIVSTATSKDVISDNGTVNCGFTNSILQTGTYGGKSSNSRYVVYTSSSTGLNVRNCTLMGGYASLWVASNFSAFSNNRLIYGGYYGIYAQSVHGNDYEFNTIDSIGYASAYYGIYDYLTSGETWNGNNFLFRDASGNPVKSYGYGVYMIEPNNSATTLPGQSLPMNSVFTNNVVQVYATQIGFLYEPINAKAPCIFAFNSISCTGGTYGMEIPIESNNANTQIFANNLLTMNSNSYGFYLYQTSPGVISGVPQWDNQDGKGGHALWDGNDINVISPSTNFATGNVTMTSYSDYKSWASGLGWETYGTNSPPNFLGAGAFPLYLDTTKLGPPGVDICTPVSNSFINYAGVQTDITGKKRCALFPTAGAFEDPFGKGSVATKIFVPSSGVYPGSPATIYQSHTAASLASYTWYIKNANYSTWTPVGNAVDLYYNGWTTGTNYLKLVTQSCYQLDADSVSFTVTAPTAVPVTDFIAASNAIEQNASDLLTDLSSNGPTKWQWSITPDSITVGTTKQPTTNQYSGSPQLDLTQNPNITFYYPGYYKVCLTAYNGLGKGATNCKANYINVVPAVNLTSTFQTMNTPTGYIFDNGGPNANYTAVTSSPYTQSVLIAPCADSIYLTFSQFDTKCGNDFVKLFNSSSPDATKQINNICSGLTGIGASGLGPGFNGGPTNFSCANYCIPNVNKPDTFKSGPKMLLTMSCYLGGAPGFAAYYWVKPSTDKTVAPSFATSNGSDSVCAGILITFKNTTKIDPKDVPSFEWDLNGDLSDGFECVGTCATAQWPYFLPGTVPVTLISVNCGGQDTIVKNITVINPPKPVAVFSVDNILPTTSDIVTFTSGTVSCVEHYKWTIVSSNISGLSAVYVNGTDATSANPQVTFPDTGFYDVTLYVDNAQGSQSNSKTTLKYIHARLPYCQPSVAQLSSAIGINHVVFNTIDNYTTPQASSGYLNFTSNTSLSTSIAVGATYYLSVSRDPNSIFSPINRDAWIDWNEDGYFTGTGENVLKDSNSTKETYTAKVIVPTTAKIGASILRIATNLYLYPNAPCGANQFGEYEDYRVYVTKYNILPVITLKGTSGLLDTMVIEQGGAYTEPGDSASSYLYGDITTSINVTSKLVGGTTSFSVLVPGTYVFSYNVTDAAGNKAITKYRVVRVTKDKTPPNLILAKNAVSGTDTIFQEVSTATIPPNLKPSLRSYVVSSLDLVDGDLKGSVIIDSSLVQLNVVGIYPVTFSSTDLDSNKAVKTLFVDVIDTIKPVLTLIGSNPDTIEVNFPFVDPSVSVSVSNNYLSKSQLIRYLHVTSTVNDSVLGVYKITYSLKDTFGNVAKSVTRIVVVVDKLPPVLTLLGPVHDSVLVNNTYYDRGYTVSDNFTKTANITVVPSGTFITSFKNNFADKLGGGRDSAKLGIAYRLTYTAKDQVGNKASVTRYIEVYDNVAPKIALVGPPVVNVCRWFPYADAGYTVSDNYSDSSHITVQTSTNFVTSGGTTLPQTLYYQYFATDQAGNTAKTDIRTIYVLSNSAAQCASGIEPGLGLNKYITVFPNPSTGIFNVEANLPASQNVRMSVVNLLGQEIQVVHDGSLMNNSFRVDLSNQASGVYFLNIVTNNQTLTKRIEIAR